MSKGFIIEFHGDKILVPEGIHFEANDINRELINSGKRPSDRVNHFIDSGHNVLALIPAASFISSYNYIVSVCPKNEQGPMTIPEKRGFWKQQLALVDQQD